MQLTHSEEVSAVGSAAGLVVVLIPSCVAAGAVSAVFIQACEAVIVDGLVAPSADAVAPGTTLTAR